MYADYEVIPSGYVENNVGGDWRKEPRLTIRSKGSSTKPKGDERLDALGPLVILIAFAAVFIAVAVAVHYAGVGVRKLIAHVKARRAAKLPVPEPTNAERIESIAATLRARA